MCTVLFSFPCSLVDIYPALQWQAMAFVVPRELHFIIVQKISEHFEHTTISTVTQVHTQ